MAYKKKHILAGTVHKNHNIMQEDLSLKNNMGFFF